MRRNRRAKRPNYVQLRYILRHRFSTATRIRMFKPETKFKSQLKGFLKLFTETGPLIVLAVVIAALIGGPAAAQFGGFGGFGGGGFGGGRPAPRGGGGW